MNIIQTQINISLLIIGMFYIHLIVNRVSSKGARFVDAVSYPFKLIIKSISNKESIDGYGILRIYLLGLVSNILFFEILKLGSENIIFSQYTLFVFLSFFLLIIKVNAFEDILVMKKTVSGISDVIFVLLLSTQYFVWKSIHSHSAINLIFFLILFIQFLFTYVLNSKMSYGNVVEKTADFLVKITWLSIMALIFLSEYRFMTLNKYLEIFIFYLIGIKLFSIIEKATLKINHNQNMTFSRMFYCLVIIILSIWSIAIGTIF